MLALTHHFIVQCAAWRSGVVPLGTWYKNYAVLGDDLVLGDLEVKTEYLKILRSLGVECGLHKSIMSPNSLCLEFAKRTIFKGKDVSPIPFREVIAASTSVASALELSTKYSLTLPTLLKVFGYGFRVLGSLDRPIVLQNAKVRNLNLSIIARSLSPDNLIDFLMIGSKGHPIFNNSLDALKEEFRRVEVYAVAMQLDHLISVLAPAMKNRNTTRAAEKDLLGYFRGVDAPLPPSQDLRMHLGMVIGRTRIGPQNDCQQAMMDMLVRVRLLLHAPKAFSNFMDMYFDVLYLREDIAALSVDNILGRRVETDGIFTGGAIPYHIKMWKKWAPLVQGTRPCSAPDYGKNLLPHALRGFTPPMYNVLDGILDDAAGINR